MMAANFLRRLSSQNLDIRQLSGNDEDWVDCSTSTGSASVDASSPTDSPSEIEKTTLLARMPPLFEPTPPPCGYELQLAYSRLIQLLRTRWLTSKGTTSLPDLCEELKDDLEDENRLAPVGHHRGTGKRKPWRREGVFHYELCWAKYFIREAIDQDLDPKGIDIKPPLVPPELGFRGYVTDVEGWEVWNALKRVAREEAGEEVSEENGDGAVASMKRGSSVEPLSPTDDLERRQVPMTGRSERREGIRMPTMNGSGEAGHGAWSSGSHD